MYKRIIMFSGGIDSAALLYEALESGCDCHAHHVFLRNSKEKKHCLKQDTACLKIVRSLKKKYNFEFTKSWHVAEFGEKILYDYVILFMHAFQLSINQKEKHVIDIAWTKNGFERQDVIYRMDNNIPQNIWKSFKNTNKNIFKNVPDFVRFPYADIYKKEIIKKIPKWLLDMTWSCRKPIYGNKCEKCLQCREISQCH